MSFAKFFMADDLEKAIDVLEKLIEMDDFYMIGPCKQYAVFPTVFIKDQVPLFDLRYVFYDENRVFVEPTRKELQQELKHRLKIENTPSGVYHVCATCKKKAVRKCSRCKQEYYCDEKCQSEDWRMHRSVCSVMTSLRKFQCCSPSCTKSLKRLVRRGLLFECLDCKVTKYCSKTCMNNDTQHKLNGFCHIFMEKSVMPESVMKDLEKLHKKLEVDQITKIFITMLNIK